MPARLQNLGQRERVLAIVFVVVGVFAIAFLLLSGGGGEKFPPIVTPSITGAPSPSATATSPPETGEAFEGKDPFQPLVITAPAVSGTPTPTPTGSSTGVNGGGTTNPAVTVTLLDVRTIDGERKATVQVEDKEYTVGVGETFASNFRVVSLSSKCGTFVFGDVRFSLCIGQEVNK